MKAEDVRHVLMSVGGYYAHIPEYTHNGLWRRIDLLRVDTKNRKAHGFEIKVNRSDFKRDTKWTEYAKFCSTLSVVCPAGLITKADVLSPYGLMWVVKPGEENYWSRRRIEWVKRPKLIEHENWQEIYLKILENEIVRLCNPIVTQKPAEAKGEGG